MPGMLFCERLRVWCGVGAIATCERLMTVLVGAATPEFPGPPARRVFHLTFPFRHRDSFCQKRCLGVIRRAEPSNGSQRGADVHLGVFLPGAKSHSKEVCSFMVDVRFISWGLPQYILSCSQGFALSMVIPNPLLL